MFTFLYLFALALGTVSPTEVAAVGAMPDLVKLGLEPLARPNYTAPHLEHFLQSSGECLPFWQGFNGRCYKYFPAQTSWADAELNCVSHNANLVNIHNQQEQDFVNAMIQNYGPGQFTWIGLSDIHKEGAWMWSDGSAVGYSFWYQGQPDNSGGNENCVHILQEHYKWNDVPCNSQYHQYPSICETRMTCPKS